MNLDSEKWLLRLPERPSIAVVDRTGQAGRFPVGRVLCVGRNYAEHAREMGSDPEREAPFFFMKPASALAEAGQIAYPARTCLLHHEVELVAAIGIDGWNLAPAAALATVFGVAVGLDLTRRDLQADLKAAGRPWEAAKVFRGAAVCGALLRSGQQQLTADSGIRLRVNGSLVQQGRLGQMIWSLAELLSEASELFGLEAGDLVYTGTPAGVRPVQAGDRLHAEVDGLPPLECCIGQEAG